MNGVAPAPPRAEHGSVMAVVPALLSSQRGGRVVVPAPVQAERGGRVLVPAPARAERGGLVAPAPARTERVVAPGSSGFEVVEGLKLPNSLAVFTRSRLPFRTIPLRLNEVEIPPTRLKLQAF